MSKLTVNVRQRMTKGTTAWEGEVRIPGTNATKLARNDGQTWFATRGALNSVARSFGKRFGFEIELAEQVKKAAKKSVTAKKSPKSKKTS